MDFSLEQIAEIVDGKVFGDKNIIISGISSIDAACKNDIIFAVSFSYFKKAQSSEAAAVLCSDNYSLESQKPLVIVENPRISFAKLINLFHKYESSYSGIHPNCIMGEKVSLNKDITIYPNVVIGNRVKIGSSTVIYSGVYIGDNVTIGENCKIYPNVVILDKAEIGNRVIIQAGAVLGSDGFGFEEENGHYYKIPQIGSVLIEDDVEIGANVCIDRATLGTTHIGKGTKLDNLIQIAHNVTLGEDIVIAALTGISGSANVGDRCAIGGQVGIAQGAKIGDRSILTAKSGVISDLPAGSKVAGFPAIEQREFFRRVTYMRKLSRIFSDIKFIREEVDNLKSTIK